MKMKRILLSLLLLASFGAFAQTSGELQTILSTSQTDQYITGAGSQTTLNNNVILASAGSGSTDAVSGGTISYQSINIQIVPAAGTVTAGAITFEGSNDNFVSAAVPLVLYDQAAPTVFPVSTYTIVASTPRYFLRQDPISIYQGKNIHRRHRNDDRSPGVHPAESDAICAASSGARSVHHVSIYFDGSGFRLHDAHLYRTIGSDGDGQ